MASCPPWLKGTPLLGLIHRIIVLVLLNLLVNDPWFTWLHPFFLLVIRIDELLDDESDLLLGEVEHLLRGVHSLLRPSEDGDGFARSD